MSNHTLHYGLQARRFDPTDFQEPSVKRILKKLSDIERAALPEEELKEVSGGGERWTHRRLHRISKRVDLTIRSLKLIFPLLSLSPSLDPFCLILSLQGTYHCDTHKLNTCNKTTTFPLFHKKSPSGGGDLGKP